ncbi:ExbD/TolR family protein [Chitinilyticum piscinae]|uniref:Biopolymer transporter ExbD n=1 Tax=Chitinilyticum piscinae TaxID=2866724 RepID=A0A8J7K242_9NEIS|nr:biopolymer transporter ExbD [Chitinilyticum piscinae]MBE9610061.1 biopolymer transporter ExbD [Chitinilyticum piscinae]
MAFGSFGGPEQAPMAEINTTPLVDVMLVLLVVFIITAPVMHHAVKVELPRATAAKQLAQKQTIRLAIAADGALQWDGQAVLQTELDARFAEVFKRDPLTEIHVFADKAARYDAVAQAMAAAQRAGLSRIGLMTAGGA